MALYQATPQDVRHGGLVIAAPVVTAGLRRLCDAFAEDGYETVATDDKGLDGLLEGLAGPRFAIGLGEASQAVWAAACGRDDLTAAAVIYPAPWPAGEPRCPVIAQVSKTAGAAPEATFPVFLHAAAPGFLLDDDAAYDAEVAKVAILRILALFRRSVGRGEN